MQLSEFNRKSNKIYAKNKGINKGKSLSRHNILWNMEMEYGIRNKNITNIFNTTTTTFFQILNFNFSSLRLTQQKRKRKSCAKKKKRKPDLVVKSGGKK